MNNKHITLKARQEITEYYDLDYTEEDFNEDKAIFKFEGITFDEVLRIIKEGDYEPLITTRYDTTNGVYEHTGSVYSFFVDRMRDISLSYGPIDTEGNEWDEDISVIDDSDDDEDISAIDDSYDAEVLG